MDTLKRSFRLVPSVVGLVVFLTSVTSPTVGHAAVVPLLDVPTNFAADSPVAGTVMATWNDIANETSYELGWGPSAITTFIPLPANTRFHTFTGLNTGVSYHFQIKACNAGGCSSSPIVGKTPNASDGVPSVPSNFFAASPVSGTDEITWNDVSEETSYELGWGPSAITTFETLPQNSTSRTFTGLNSGISYHFKIRACNGAGCSDWTTIIGQTPNGANGLPPVPSNFATSSPAVGMVNVTWNDVANETSYELGWGPSAITEFITLSANATPQIFIGLNAGTSYHFKIRACNAAGCSNYTTIIGQTPGGPPTCTLSQTASYAGGMVTLSYTIGANVATTWKMWVVGGFGFIEALSISLPVVDPPFSTGPISFPLPAMGTVGFLTALTTPAGGLICSDFDTVNTGPGPASK
jgi:hypothetical protein